ncbi:hypothetical protein F2Z80_03795 [Vibrio fortis]|jgi:hypothetical protein|uniref:Uncharacterized protein n=1 Tax=Vibrio fortis TaxID=212667 RepID=A0A5N3SBN1_9VIBR|nr:MULTISPECIES: hypothetical protein [Vibrio]KAB0303133.1 hypothetical protein F2Z80_03795 [Vibrio fortis]QFT10380.1 hypothetical protein FIV04_10375 [Vibrio sp. THAF190c]|tara:strand:+ start:2694 stop:3047 length:354 start_codon:yes stop_codon:yes gene_type:complete
MTPVTNNATQTYSPAKLQPTKGAPVPSEPAPLKVEQNTVKLSDEGKALLVALQQIDKEAKKIEAENETVGDKVESFAHGALGMDHPDKIEEEEDGSYSAGQYLSAAVTIGGILLALV